MEMILGKMGEVVLKGGNRPQFISRMLRVIRARLKPLGRFNIYEMQSTVYVEPQDEDIDCDEAFEIVKRVFGLVAVVRAYDCEKELKAIQRAACEKLAPALERARTFKVETKRSDKRFPLGSPEISREVGAAVLEAFPHLKVDVHSPDTTVYVEVRDRAAYVHTDPTPGAGGLPQGSAGRAAVLLSGGIDSPVAAWMMARRGLELEAVHFFSYPYTSERAKQKVLDLAKILVKHTGYMTVHVVPFTEIQERIRDRCPEEYFTILMRRSMMRIADRVAELHGCSALITGESLGQVASQTVKALGATGSVVSRPVFRPLIGMDKEEIVRVSRRIGAFETSILPYEDCCTVFTPKHPKTRPQLEAVEAVEAPAELAELEDAAVANIESIKIPR